MSNPRGKGLEAAQAARSAKAVARRAGKPDLTLEDLAARCGLDLDTFISKLTALLAGYPRAIDRPYPMPGSNEAMPAPAAPASPQALERETASAPAPALHCAIHPAGDGGYNCPWCWRDRGSSLAMSSSEKPGKRDIGSQPVHLTRFF